MQIIQPGLLFHRLLNLFLLFLLFEGRLFSSLSFALPPIFFSLLLLPLLLLVLLLLLLLLFAPMLLLSLLLLAALAALAPLTPLGRPAPPAPLASLAAEVHAGAAEAAAVLRKAAC